VNQILSTIHIENRLHRFPEAYLGEYGGELEYVDYEWQTRRYPVNAAVQELADGRSAVTAGNTDGMTDPLIDRGDRDERKRPAEYVHAAVDGRNVTSGEETSIPMPVDDEGVAALLDALADDRQTVAETDVEAIETEIDAAVYDLFELDGEERQVVEEYPEVW